MASPQGRFATGAELLTGRVVERIEPYGKHLFYGFEGDLLLHVHLGLYGKFDRRRRRAAGAARGAAAADDHRRATGSTCAARPPARS